LVQGEINCSGTGTVFRIVTITNLTVSGTPVVNITSTGSTALSVRPGSPSEANSISFNFTGGTYSLSFLDISGYAARNVDFTGYAGTLAAFHNVTIFGNLTFSTGMSSTINANNRLLSFKATSGTQLITTNGRTLNINVACNGVGGTVQLQDALTMSSFTYLQLVNGTLDLNGFTLTAGYAMTGNGTKNITFNGGTLLVGSNTFSAAWYNLGAQPISPLQQARVLA
jgi:hypothetical protein